MAPCASYWRAARWHSSLHCGDSLPQRKRARSFRSGDVAGGSILHTTRRQRRPARIDFQRPCAFALLTAAGWCSRDRPVCRTAAVSLPAYDTYYSQWQPCLGRSLASGGRRSRGNASLLRLASAPRKSERNANWAAASKHLSKRRAPTVPLYTSHRDRQTMPSVALATKMSVCAQCRPSVAGRGRGTRLARTVSSTLTM